MKKTQKIMQIEVNIISLCFHSVNIILHVCVPITYLFWHILDKWDALSFLHCITVECRNNFNANDNINHDKFKLNRHHNHRTATPNGWKVTWLSTKLSSGIFRIGFMHCTENIAKHLCAVAELSRIKKKKKPIAWNVKWIHHQIIL